MASGSSSRHRLRQRNLLRCFCGCTELSPDEVKRIYRLSAQETLINQQASKIFRAFLEKSRLHNGDRTVAEEYLDAYEICERNINERRIIDADELDELIQAGLPYPLERELRKEIMTGERFQIEMCLRRIQGYSRNEIASSNEYKNYKQAILDKLKNLPN